ncbi:MAG TPA: sulfotransferase [Stenotrophomonas sp.]
MTSPAGSTGAEQQLRQLYGRAVEALNHGQWDAAGRLSQELLLLAPGHAGVQFVAGVAALGRHQLALAITHLREAVRLNPARPDYMAQLARAFTSAGSLGEAVEVASRALQLPAVDPLAFDTLGVVLTRCNEHKLAAQAFAHAVRLLPRRAGYRYNLATSLMFVGDISGAEHEYEACVDLDPRQWRAHLALSQLRKQEEHENHLPRLSELLAQHDADPEAGLYLNLAVAKELEDLGRYQASLEHLAAGKKRVAAQRRYDVQVDAELFSTLASAFDGSRQETPGHASAEPIFVLGMPRSGTTLADRIISSHPLVHSAGELMNFPMAVRRLSGAGGRTLLDRDVVTRSSRMDWERLGQMYIDSTRPGTGALPHFVDKLPHNFQYVGHILHALPNAKVILMRRNAMDTCLGNFRQLFAMESSFYDYSFDLLDVGRYYIQFDKLMSHWIHVFPERILTVNYEDLVADQERVTRGLLAHCDLPWAEECMRFHENSAPTATASVVQVREPLHGRFVRRWDKYGQALDPLRLLLEGAGIAVE